MIDPHSLYILSQLIKLSFDDEVIEEGEGENEPED